MIEEILPGLYEVEITLPKNPLKATNSYESLQRVYGLEVNLVLPGHRSDLRMIQGQTATLYVKH